MKLDEKSLLHRDSAGTIFDTWSDYIKGDNLFTNNVEGVSRRLQEEKEKLFSSEGKMEVSILNILECADEHGMQTRRRTVYNSSDLGEYLSRNTTFHTRFISIPAINSIKPLRITESAMYSILSQHNIGSQFLDLLLSFATGGKESEAGPGNMTIKHYPDGSYESQYRFSYVESHNNNKWAIRQTVVYHRRVPNGSGNVWILLHPKSGSTLQDRLETCALEWEDRKGPFNDWELTHILILSSYFDNWRWYLKSLSAEVEQLIYTAVATDFSMCTYGKGTNVLQDLHALLNKIMPISTRLRSTAETVASLKSLYETLQKKNLNAESHSMKILDEFRAYETKTEEHENSAALLEKKIQETVRLITVALSLRSQSTALSINRNIFSLTKDTVDDSATVRVVTVVTLIYLPASFVTSLLGMNLFTYQTSAGSGFQVSRQFWVFILITIPLTVITVGSWIFAARRRQRQKNREHERRAYVGGDSEET